MDLSTHLEKVDQLISKNIIGRSPIELYEPATYALGVGGKRIRPSIVLLGSYACGGLLEDAYTSAGAIELFHNFTLLHDDIMDNAPLRRNNATVWKKYGQNTAILSGDAMLVLGYSMLSVSPKFAQLATVFSKAALEVCEGQQLSATTKLDTKHDLFRLSGKASFNH